MLSSEEREMIIKHVLEKEEHLSVALGIVSSFGEIRKRIIIKFLNDLESRLKTDLSDDWEIDMNLRDNPFERYQGVFLSKDSWKGKYMVGIEADNKNAEAFCIGVKKEKEDCPQVEDLYSGLNSRYRHGAHSPMWVWWHWLDTPYYNQQFPLQSKRTLLPVAGG